MAQKKRTCDGCTACCKTHGIRELGKPSGMWCPLCTIGKGCNAYGNRPQSCRDFQCAWLADVNNNVTEASRPDRTGIVAEYNLVLGANTSVLLWEVWEGALQSSYARTWTKLNLKNGWAVAYIPVVDTPKFYLPKGAEVSGPLRLYTTDGGVKLFEIVPFVEGRF